MFCCQQSTIITVYLGELNELYLVQTLRNSYFKNLVNTRNVLNLHLLRFYHDLVYSPFYWLQYELLTVRMYRMLTQYLGMTLDAKV